MPGELGDELTQQGVGYYEHLYQPTGEWMLSGYGNLPGQEKGNQSQLKRLMKKLKKKKKKYEEDT